MLLVASGKTQPARTPQCRATHVSLTPTLPLFTGCESFVVSQKPVESSVNGANGRHYVLGFTVSSCYHQLWQ